jgi:hypothetical protein
MSSNNIKCNTTLKAKSSVVIFKHPYLTQQTVRCKLKTQTLKPPDSPGKNRQSETAELQPLPSVNSFISSKIESNVYFSEVH